MALIGQMNEEEAKEAWQEVANPIEKFIATFCYTGADHDVPLGEFVDAFNYYLDKQGKAPQSYHQIRKSVNLGLGYSVTKKRPSWGGNPVSTIFGLDLRSSAKVKPKTEDKPF